MTAVALDRNDAFTDLLGSRRGGVHRIDLPLVMDNATTDKALALLHADQRALGGPDAARGLDQVAAYTASDFAETGAGQRADRLFSAFGLSFEQLSAVLARVARAIALDQLQTRADVPTRLGIIDAMAGPTAAALAEFALDDRDPEEMAALQCLFGVMAYNEMAALAGGADFRELTNRGPALLSARDWTRALTQALTDDENHVLNPIEDAVRAALKAR